MKFALAVPNIGPFASITRITSIAREAESSGWDGVFMWDLMIGEAAWGGPPACDPWVATTAIALATERIRIGTMITPIARRRPWKLARETVSVDRLSRGRLTLGVGLGNPPDDFTLLGEDADNRVRASKLDEGLEVLTGLWSGEPFSYEGKHYRLSNVRFLPPPVQQPRIPIWVGGQWPNKAPMRRAARYDGAYPVRDEGRQPLSVDDVRDCIEFVRANRETPDSFDLILTGNANKDGAQQTAGPALQDYAAAGATWWINELWYWAEDWDDLRRRVLEGPPNI